MSLGATVQPDRERSPRRVQQDEPSDTASLPATDPVIEDKHAAALEKTISKASDVSNSGKDFSFGSDEVPPEVKDMSTGHAISA